FGGGRAADVPGGDRPSRTPWPGGTETERADSLGVRVPAQGAGARLAPSCPGGRAAPTLSGGLPSRPAPTGEDVMGGRNRLWLVSIAVMLAACSDDQLREVHGNLVVEPDPLHFGRVAIGNEETRTLTIRNRGKGAIALLGIERGADAPAAFAIPSPSGQTIRGGRSIEISVRFRPEEEKRYRGSLILATNDEGRSRIEVPLDGTGERAS